VKLKLLVTLLSAAVLPMLALPVAGASTPPAAAKAVAATKATTNAAAKAATKATVTKATTAAEDLGVNLGDNTGPVSYGADGALYGIYDQGVPSENLIEGMGLKTTDTKAQDGQQHPGSDALEIAQPFVQAGGQAIYIYMTDVYRDFPYERTSYAQYQGYMKQEIEQDLTSPYLNRIVLVPYNEPDGNWFAGLQSDPTTLAAFENEWLETYQFIHQLWPGARIAGPNFYQYQASALASFLAFCQANHCLPNVITWHELANPSTIEPDVAAFRTLEASLKINLPVSLDEYAAQYQMTSPGRMVSFLSAIANAKVSGDLPYWNQNGTLGDSVSENNIPNAQWWLYNWYSSLTGHTVAVTPPDGNTDNTLQALATVDNSKKQARIILGGGPAETANVTVKDAKIFGNTVHATVLDDQWSGMTGAAAAPTTVYSGDLATDASGDVNIPMNITGPPNTTTGCDATGPRAQGKIGGAVSLCGNNEYIQLPTGVVSGLNNFTVSAWVNPSVDSTWSRVFDFGTGTNDYMFLTVNDGSNIRYAITTSGAGGEQQINGTSALPVNTWSLVTVTLNGTTGTLYVNGQPVGTNDDMTLTPADLGVTNQNYIGKSQYDDPYLSGEVSDFNIYNTALSATQVAALAGGQVGAGNVVHYTFDEASGATVDDSSGNGQNATIISDPASPTSMDAYEIILSPGGTQQPAANATWTQSYPAADATMTGTGWNINTEGTPTNLGGFATYGDQDVGGLRTGSTTVIDFNVNVPATGNYTMRVFDGSYAQADDVSGPTNIFARVDGGPSTEVWLPDGYQWVIWNYGSATLHLTAGAHTISLSTTGDNGATTLGDAIIDKIDLTLNRSNAVVYPASLAQLSKGAHGQQATFWVYSADDGYSDLALSDQGQAQTTVNGLPLRGPGHTYRVYLSAGINKVVVTGQAILDNLTVTPATGPESTYQAADGALTGTAKVVTGYSQASGGVNGGVVTGVGGGPANSLTLTVKVPEGGEYGMTVRYANNQGIIANHYNPDLMTAPADISINGAPTFHVNFANTFDWNQFWKLTIPVRLRAGVNTIKFIANPQYNWGSTTIGYIYSGSDIGDPLRSETAPNIDQITLAPFQITG
jgi:Concanavalin A-like lectin/glucanases superfamily/Carbohydrate binding module (family 6)